MRVLYVQFKNYRKSNRLYSLDYSADRRTKCPCVFIRLIRLLLLVYECCLGSDPNEIIWITGMLGIGNSVWTFYSENPKIRILNQVSHWEGRAISTASDRIISRGYAAIESIVLTPVLKHNKGPMSSWSSRGYRRSFDRDNVQRTQANSIEQIRSASRSLENRPMSSMLFLLIYSQIVFSPIGVLKRRQSFDASMEACSSEWPIETSDSKSLE